MSSPRGNGRTGQAADSAVHKHNILMKDFPLDELLAATDLEKVQEAIVLIFAHLNKKLKISYVRFQIRLSFVLADLTAHTLFDELCR